MKTVDDWRARFKKSSTGSVEIRQTETAQIQPELRSEPRADKNVGVDNLQSHKSIQPHSNEIFTSKIGVASPQTLSWLQHQTSANCFENPQTQPKLHSEASSDKFLTSRSCVESLQTQTGVLLQKACVNDRANIPTQSGLHTEPSPEKSKPGVKPPQAQTGCQLQTMRANSFGSLHTQPKLHSESSSDKIVAGASGIESLQTQTGLQPQRACANVCESIRTQPVFHTKPSSDKSKSGGKHVQAQPRFQLQTLLENSSMNLYGQPKLHTEHGSDKMSTSRSGVESLQSQSGVQLQKELANDCESKPSQLGFHTEPPLDKRSTSRSGVESLQSQSGVQHQKELANDCESKPTQSGFNTEPSSDKRNGIKSPQAQPGLQLQTCAYSDGNLHTQQKLHSEGISDKILTSRSVVESLQTQAGSQSLGPCANNCESVPIQSGLHTKPTLDKSRNGVKRPQAQPGLQLRTTCANSFGNRNTLPKLHTEHRSDKINVAESSQAQAGIQLQREHANDYVSVYTQPGFHISDDRNVVKTLQAQRGLLLQRTCADGHNILRTQPGPHTKPCSNKSSLGPATGGNNPSSGTNTKLSPYELASSSIGCSHLVYLSNNNFRSRGPTEDSINATPIISSPAVKEKRFMLEDESKLENRLLSTPNLVCLPKSDASPLQLRSDSQVGGKKRDSDLHRLIFMENGLPDGSQLSYRLKGEIKLRGEKVKNGIKCSCCNEKVTPSKFELHAGHREKRQPYKHIYYDKADLTLHELCLSLMSGQSLSTTSANLCMVCGCGGDLVTCDQCQKASHAGCLKLKCGLDGELHCPYCKSRLGNTSAARFTSIAARPRKIRLTRMIKDTLQELGSGCVLCKTKEFTLETFCAETIIVCHQCEKEYHVGCLRFHGRCDLKAYPGKWFCCSECNLIHAALRTIVFHGPKVVPELLLGTLTKEGVKPTNELGVEMHWQLLGGKYQPSSDLLPEVAAIFQDAFNPIIKRGQDLMHTMIFGKSEAGECFEGMFSAVLIIDSVIVSAGILRIFGTGIAELPLVATRSGSQGKGYFRTLLFLIERLLSRLKVEVLMVPVACDEQSWWIRKFGFKKMTEELWTKYASEIPLLSFEKMTVLEKAVPRTLNDISYDELFMYTIVNSELSSMDTVIQPLAISAPSDAL